MELQIKKVKIDAKGFPEINYVEVREDGKNPNINHDCPAIAHDDFINAVSELAAHYALITGYASFSKGLKLDALKTGVSAFKPSGYSIGGKEDNEGITITGHIIVSWSGKACIVNSPFLLFDEGDESKYKFIDDLAATVEKIANEAKEYIVNRKFKPEVKEPTMPELPFGEDGKIEGDLSGNLNTVVSESGELQSVPPEEKSE